MTRRGWLGPAVLMAGSLAALGVSSDPAPDPLRHPGVFSFGPRAAGHGGPAPAIDLTIVVPNRIAPRNEELPLAPTGAERTGRDFAAPAADPLDVYGGTRSSGTYGCRAGSICSATGSGSARLRDLFGD